MKKNFYKILIIGFLMLIPSDVFAEAVLPEVMVGQTTVTISDPNNSAFAQKFYGGIAGNETVLNYRNDAGQTSGKSSGYYYNFTGNSNYARAADTPALALKGDFTISLWFRPPTGETNGGYLLQKSCDNSTGCSGAIDSYSIYVQPGTANQVTANVRLNGVNKSLTTTYTSGQWNCLVFNRHRDVFSLSINDNAPVTGTYSGPILYNSGRLYVAISDTNHDGIISTGTPAPAENTAANTYGGDIDELKIFSGYVDAVSIYKSTEDQKDMTLYWDFENSLTDKTGNGADGTFSGAGTRFYKTTPAFSPNPSHENNGYNPFGFNPEYLNPNYWAGRTETSLVGCVNGIILNPALVQNRCFVADGDNANITLMTSRTYIGSNETKTPVNELAALLYPPKPTLVGDANLKSSNPSDFAYWGRNLTQSTVGVSPDSFIGLNYTINPNAQSNLSGTQYTAYKARIDQLKTEASAISGFGGTWYLQNRGTSMATENQDLSQYPEGRIWKIGSAGGNYDLGHDTTYYYKGIGTIIVLGDLTIGKNINIQPLDNSSRLGFVVYGNTFINGGNKVKASIVTLGITADSFCGQSGLIVRDSNVTLTGSFVAFNFDFRPISIINGNYCSVATGYNNNVGIYYDPNLDSSWPPGFRDLEMPHPTE